MPTPEEWTAVLGISAIGALLLTLKQLKQVDESNRLLESSMIEATRPKVIAYLDLQFITYRSIHSDAEAYVGIIIKNIGASTAHDVRLFVTPPFELDDRFFENQNAKPAQQKINADFNGQIRFHTLAPNIQHQWMLGYARQMLASHGTIQDQWEITIEYTDPAANRSFSEVFHLRLPEEIRRPFKTDQITRISKNIAEIEKHLKSISQGINIKTISNARKNSIVPDSEEPA